MSSTCSSPASSTSSLAFVISPSCSIGLSSSCEIRVAASAEVPMPTCRSLSHSVTCDAMRDSPSFARRNGSSMAMP
ncbi:hypothetical protein BDW62DRAFT_194197 [Aspergillus aurantiobrunneus]